jgi:hypothetical protein
MAEYDRSATGPLPVDAGPRRAESIFDLSPEDFRASLGEMQALGHDTDALMRQYRARNSPFAPINNAAEAQAQDLADSGRRPVLGGLLSKPEGATGMDAIMGLEREGWRGLLGAGQQVGQAFDAPAAAYQGVIPQADVNMEALNTAGVTMGAGGAATAPSGALRSGLAREVAESPAQGVARLLREGRASEVTDDVLARLSPNDNAELFRLYDEGATGIDMPMDAVSRLARADAGGFGGDLYHGSNADFAAFDPKMTEAGLQGRGAYAAQGPDDTLRFLDDEADGASIMPARMSGDTYSSDAASRIDPLTDEGRGLLSRFNLKPNRNYSGGNGGVGEQIYDLSRRRAGRSVPEYTPEWIAEIHRLENDRLESAGYGNRIDEYTGYQMALDPSNIRSRFARFDPRLSSNANLLAANASQSGGLLGAGLSEAQRQARDILDMRAAGNARSVTDDMMARADDQYMFDNTPLPMDEASRLARADAGGFDTTAYHETGRDFPAFDTSRLGAGAGDSEMPTGVFTKPTGASIGLGGVGESQIPLMTRRGNNLEVIDRTHMRSEGAARGDSYMPAWHAANDFDNANALRYDSKFEGGAGQSWLSQNPEDYFAASNAALAEWNARNTELGQIARGHLDDSLRRDGVDSVTVQRDQGSMGRETPSTIILDPSNIRSRFARFDPEFSHLSNLSAANASPTAGLLASGAQEQDKPLPFMEMLRGLLR